MTKEEAKEILISALRDINSDSGGFECTAEQFTEAMLIAIEELSRSSLPCLPSNLDEAAKEWKEEHFIREYYQIPKDAMSDSFKAGAEWMAEQGISCEAEAVKDVGISFLKEPFEKAAKKFDGKVIVQIRKKEK